MAKRSLRPQLNQIRAWVREGRTDAWIAHQLEVPASELREFRRRHGLTRDGGEEAATEADLRDEIEAEIEAAARAGEEVVEAEEEEEEEEAETEEPEEVAAEKAEGEEAPREEPAEGQRRRRRRRRRRRVATLEATFDHGETDGIGLWLDPAVQDDPIYAEHWAGHRPVEVSIEADRITIRRV